jgi:hypothetical protein
MYLSEGRKHRRHASEGVLLTALVLALVVVLAALAGWLAYDAVRPLLELTSQP